MMPLNLPPGEVKVIPESDLPQCSAEGWRVIAVVDKPVGVTYFKEVLPASHSGPITQHLSRQKFVVTPHYLIFRETEVGEAVMRLQSDLELLRSRCHIAEAAATATATQKDTMEAQVRRLTERCLEAEKLAEDQTILLLEARRAYDEVTRDTTLREDWEKVIRALGADVVSRLVGHEVIDPHPVEPEQIPSVYARLLEDDEDENATFG